MSDTKKTNKTLLYSIGNINQYFVISYKEKESEKKMCITESMFCTPEMNTALLINYTANYKKDTLYNTGNTASIL